MRISSPAQLSVSVLRKQTLTCLKLCNDDSINENGAMHTYRVRSAACL